MGFLRSVLHYASAAWSVISGAVTDPAQALIAVWHFIGSVQTLLDHMFSSVNKDVLSAFLFYVSIVDDALKEYVNAIRRIASWIWGKQVNPVRLNLLKRLAALQALLHQWVVKLITMIVTYYVASIRYTNQQVGLERKYRLADIAITRKYAVSLVKGALATVQRQASDGYNSQTRQRESIIAKIADDLAVRNPVLKTAITDLIKLALDAAEVDDPVLRLALSKALQEVIDRLGVDKVMGEFLSTLIGQLTGTRPPDTLQGVTADIAARLTALENQWADFMASGGPEVEEAGGDWKKYASIAGDLALVAFFAQAVADPNGWAREVNDTAGAVVNGTFTAVADLIKGA